MIPPGAQAAKAAVFSLRGLVLFLATLGAATAAPATRAQEPPAAPATHGASVPPGASFESLMARALAGDAEAQTAVGVAYRGGKGVAQDGKQARAWLEKAGAQKHPAALRMLGDMYAKGEGGRKNKKKALESWRAAEAAGDPYAPILVADRMFADLTGGKAPGPGKFKIAGGTPIGALDDTSAWYGEALKRDPRPDVRRRAELALNVLKQVRAGLIGAGHPE